MQPNAEDVRAHLRQAGVTVHSTSQLGPGSILVVLEGSLAQELLAVVVAEQIDGVLAAVVSPVSRSMVYVALAPL